MKRLGFLDADWSLDQALIWMATRRADLVNEASDDPFVPPERRLRWATFLLRDNTGGVPRAEIKQKLLQAIKQGDVKTAVDGEPVDPRAYSPAQYVMDLDGVAFRWTDQTPFLTSILEGDARHERRHQRELRPRLEIADLVRLYPDLAAAASNEKAVGKGVGVDPMEPRRIVSFKMRGKIGDIEAVVAKRKAMRVVWDAATATQQVAAIAAAREGGGAPKAGTSPSRKRKRNYPGLEEGDAALVSALVKLERHYDKARDQGVPAARDAMSKHLAAAQPTIMKDIGSASTLRRILGGHYERVNKLVVAGEVRPWWKEK